LSVLCLVTGVHVAILSSHLRLCLPSCLFLSVFFTRTLYVFLFSPCTLDLIILYKYFRFPDPLRRVIISTEPTKKYLFFILSAFLSLCWFRFHSTQFCPIGSFLLSVCCPLLVFELRAESTLGAKLNSLPQWFVRK
jgi:hypothetical protein